MYCADDGHEASTLVLEKSAVRNYNSENSVAHVQVTFYGNPERVTHIVIGDSHISRVAAMNMLRYQGYEEATRGLVLINIGGRMMKLRSVARQFIRGLYFEMQESFDTVGNKIRISIALGYNDVDKRIEEFFSSAVDVLNTFKHILADVPAEWSVHLAEVPFGRSMHHCHTVQINYVISQLNRLLGPQVPLRLWTAQIGADKTDEQIKPVNCLHVNIMVERNMLDPHDDRQWHNNRDIMELTRDVIFDWARGVARCSGQYPPNNTYPTLVEYELSLRSRTVVLNEDYFKLRQEKVKQAYDHPLDPTAIAAAAEFPNPSMRLQGLREKLIPRPNYEEDEDRRSRSGSHSSSVRERLGPAPRG